jgi:glycosyltransferase involved in cell wall biosynthesis
MTPRMNLVFVGHRCCDHSPSSGYDQICALFPDAGWLHGPDLAVGRLSWHREPAGPADLSRALFHVFYGDCSGSRLPAILRERFPQATIVSTIHQPITRLKADPAGWAALRLVDGIITVAQTQADELAEQDLAASIHHVPHGVWTHVFRPPAQPPAEPRDHVLLVGNYLRDWTGTQHIVGMLAAAGVRSVVLGSAAPTRLAIDHPLVEIASRVSESDLAVRYDRAAALVLPVIDATASNALLEAMSAGCPVICPALPSLVDEYLGDASDAYQPGRYDQAVARALAYVQQPHQRAAKPPTLITRAALFDWTRLRPRLDHAYHQTLRHAARLDPAPHQ